MRNEVAETMLALAPTAAALSAAAVHLHLQLCAIRRA